jgi:hypothetical protein
VTGDFCAILAGIRMRGAEDGNQHLVDVADMAVVDGIGVGRREVLGEYTGKNLKRLVS